MLKQITQEDFNRIESLFNDLIEKRKSTEYALSETVKDDVRKWISNGDAVILALFERTRPLGFVMSYPESYMIGIIHVDDTNGDSSMVRKRLFDEAFTDLSKENAIIRTGGPSIDPDLSEHILKKGFRRYDRATMRIARKDIDSLSQPSLPDEFDFGTYGAEMRRMVAKLIHKANANHIESESYPEYFGSDDGAMRLIEEIEKHEHHPFSKVLLRGEEVIGVCFIILNTDEAGHIAEICVDNDYRKIGLGRNLLVYSLKETARSLACLNRITLDVTLKNTARRLYQSLGFEDMNEFTVYTWISELDSARPARSGMET